VGDRTLVMAVVNITPDSFSDGGLYFDSQKAVAHALRLLDEGADLLDLGAESTRPGSHAGEPGTAAVSAEEEQERLLPVIEAVLKARPKTIISVDTYKSATARAAIEAGAEIVNDVSGLVWDSQMASVCAELACGVVLMHSRGRPGEWSEQPALDRESALMLVRDGLISSLRIVLDPGYGFGKRFDENYALLALQWELLALGRPLLAGVSRKSFLAKTLERLRNDADLKVSKESREIASIAAQVAAILKGASIVRVHKVKEAVEAAAIADEVLAAE